VEHCDGRTHSEMTDAYDHYSYPCPGPEKCPNSKLPHELPEALKPKKRTGFLRDPDAVPRWDKKPR
jgi:hypothetical protein